MRAVHGREIGEPVRHDAEHVAGEARTQTGHDLGAARDGEADAEGQDQRLALQPEAQEAVEQPDARRRRRG